MRYSSPGAVMAMSTNKTQIYALLRGDAAAVVLRMIVIFRTTRKQNKNQWTNVGCMWWPKPIYCYIESYSIPLK